MNIFRKWKGTADDARDAYQRAIEKHSLGAGVPLERIAAAIEGKIELGEIDYAWGHELQKAWKRLERFMKAEERDRARSQRLAALSRQPYGGIADLA